MLEDNIIVYSKWAALGGIEKSCLQKMEIYTLKSLDYKLHVTLEEYNNKMTEIIYFD